MAEVTTPQTPVTETPSTPSPKPVKKKGAQKRKLFRRILALAIAAVIFGGGGYMLYQFLNSGEDELGEIYFQEAEIGSIQSKVSGSGTAKAKESAAITLTASGTVQEVFVTGGDVVYAGQPLYQIYSQAAEDAVSDARKTLEDDQKTLTKKYKELADLQADAANLTVRAPFAGKLQDVTTFEVDADVSKGDTVATLVNDRKLKLSLYFSYAYENDISVGQSVSVSVPAVMESFPGKVEEIHKVRYITSEGSVHFEVVVAFDNPGTLTAGMDASAVLTTADGTSVYSYESGKTEFYETRTITAKTAGPVLGWGNLYNYADVEAGEALLYLGSSSLDDDIQDKQDEITSAQETIDTDQTKLDEVQSALDDFNAVSPIDGTVTACNLTPGAEVKSGDTAIMITNNTTMLVTITVDDRNISYVKPGSYVDLDWNGNVYQGQVTTIDMSGAQSGSGMTSYPVTLTVDNYDGTLIEGAWLQYSFVTSESEDCVLVPTSAVKYFTDTEGNRQSVVFVQRDEEPDELPDLDLPTFAPGEKRTYPSQEEGFYPVIVETGLSDTQNVEIISGVEAGESVFINYTVTDSSYAW